MRGFNLIVFSLCLFTSTALTQTKLDRKFDLVFNHQALFVASLEVSTKFYTTILGLKEIENKTKRADIRWLSMGNGTELHLISGDNKGIVTMKSVHFAFATSDFDGFMKHLNAKKIEFSDWPGESRKFNTRPDGVRQIYLQDPDGYWIEINDSPVK